MNSDRAIWRAAEQMSAAQRAELEQARLRVTIPGIVLVVFAGYVIFGGELSVNEVHALWFTIGFFLFAIATTLHILATHDVSVLRRYAGIVADNVGITFWMLVAGEQGAIVFFVYLFVTFGNGFRYGPAYLHLSQALSVIGFATICYFSDFWSQHVWFAAGLFVAMLVLPLYVSTLVRRIEEARKRAEEANRRAGVALQEAQQQVRELSRKLTEFAPPTA